ncbi:MAG TPA: DUF952 domain-containing protein [Rhizomicrobium sp.]|nr:DUF952 domain-containing protein [Rhizomicrobium sp.]
MLVFKIVLEEEWNAALEAGVYRGSAADKKDNFIHLSTSKQLAGTLARHFAHVTEPLLLIAIDSDSLGAHLKWEEGSNGESYPHLYHSLDLSLVLWNSTIPLKAPGVFALPVEAFVEQKKNQNPFLS